MHALNRVPLHTLSFTTGDSGYILHCMYTVYNDTLTLCCMLTFALLSSSTFTHSTCPACEALISAVHPHCYIIMHGSTINARYSTITHYSSFYYCTSSVFYLQPYTNHQFKVLASNRRLSMNFNVVLLQAGSVKILNRLS